jgi:hypothetical protein
MEIIQAQSAPICTVPFKVVCIVKPSNPPMLFASDKHKSTPLITINNLFSSFSHFLKPDVNILAIPIQLFPFMSITEWYTQYSNKCVCKDRQAKHGTFKTQQDFHFKILHLVTFY